MSRIANRLSGWSERRTRKSKYLTQIKQQLRWVVFIGLGLAIALIVRFPTPAIAQSASETATATSTTEIRGVWLTNVDSDVLFSRDNLRQALRRLARLNFNTVYPTVWNGGYTLYPSQVAEEVIGEKIDPSSDFKDRDVLKEAVEMGHSRKLAVIPWFEFGLMAPVDSDLANRHRDWISNRHDGSQAFKVHDEEVVWLNPAHPGVQQFFINMIAEVVAKYDVDGIQFDDHFGMPVQLGYDPYTIRLYQVEHQGKLPPDNPSDAEWMRWRASKLTDLMIRIHAAVKALKPDCLVSLAPNPRAFSYQTYLQDWMTWQQQGLLDELIVQVYRNNLNGFVSELDRPELRTIRSQIPVGIGILTGLRVLNVDIDQIQAQVRTARSRQFAGVSFFFYESLGSRDAALRALFPRPAIRPDRGYGS